jgi:hypothetical protein
MMARMMTFIAADNLSFVSVAYRVNASELGSSEFGAAMR